MREEVLERLEAARRDPEAAPPAAGFRFKALEVRAPAAARGHPGSAASPGCLDMAAAWRGWLRFGARVARRQAAHGNTAARPPTRSRPSTHPPTHPAAHPPGAAHSHLEPQASSATGWPFRCQRGAAHLPGGGGEGALAAAGARLRARPALRQW